MILRFYLFFTVFLNYFAWYLVESQVPAIRCPQYFQYLTQGGAYLGKLTIPNVLPGATKVYVQFSQRQNLITPNYYGRLSLYEDKQTTVNKIYSRQPVLYRVDFPIANVLPKLTLIQVNGVAICTDYEYPPPSITLRLMHELSSADLGASLMPYQNVQQQPNQINSNRRRPAAQTDLGAANSNVSPNVQPFQNRQTQIRQPQRQQTVSQTAVQAQPTAGLRTYAECGLENQVITPFIVGGELLSPRQFPWLAAIYISTGANLKFTCGGTLVSQRTVITAAHCFLNAGGGGVEVHLGHYDLEDYSEKFETRRVQQIIKHPEFRPTTLPDADIAVLLLSSPVSFSASIRPICLWNEQTDVNILVGQKAAVAGWGEDETRRIQSKPKKAIAHIVSLSECQTALQRNLVPATARSICVRSVDGSTPCRGDSGGGLVVLRNGRWVLRGIISGGNSNDRGCLLDYTFFCDLAQHRTWLYRNIV